MKYITRGSGRPLLLVHGLGGSWRSWAPILDALADRREVIAVDLPGFGATPPLSGACTIAALADAVARFVKANGITGVDAVGSSMGARLVLELARRGVLGSVVALAPVGFWRGWERHAFYGSIAVSIRLVRALQPVMPFLTRHALTRAGLFAQLSARPWHVPPRIVLDEMRTSAASPSFDDLLHELAYGEPPRGAPYGTLRHRCVIGWGRKDRVCFPRQAERALALFPDAHLHWFESAGHFPQWDSPAETVRLVLATTASWLEGGGTQRVDDASHLAGRTAKPAGDLGVRDDVDSRR